jgi:hypothetical protein
MATQTSSLIGANLGGNGDTTALFALGTVAFGSQGSEWEYVYVTSTHVTGKIVIINQNGTGKVALPAMLTAYGTQAQFGFVQNAVNQGEYTWVAKRGRGLYVLCSATFTSAPDSAMGFALSANSGRLIGRAAGADGTTMFGVFCLSNPATSNVTEGVVGLFSLLWPRAATNG